jgi:hypothetical protein
MYYELSVKDTIVNSHHTHGSYSAAATTIDKPYTTASTSLDDSRQALEQPAMIQGDLPKQEQILISTPYQTYS